MSPCTEIIFTDSLLKNALKALPFYTSITDEMADKIVTTIFSLSDELFEHGSSGKPMHLNASKLIRTKFPRCWQRQKKAFDIS